MNLDKLKVNMKFKNYPILCKYIDEKVKSGCSKKSQLKQWKRYFDFTNEGQAFIITKIYDTPKLSEDQRQRYITYVEPLLLNYLFQHIYTDDDEPVKVEYTYKRWCIEIGLTSGKAYDEKLIEEYTAPESQWKPLAVRRAINDIKTQTNQALKSATGHLQKQGILKTTDNYYIVINNAHRLATAEERSYIKKVEQRIYDELHIKNRFPINMSPKKGAQYNKRTLEIYREERGWDKAYLLLEIEIINPSVIRQYENINKEELENSFRQELLKRMQEQLDKEQHSPTKDTWEDLAWGDKFQMSASLAREIEELQSILL